MISNELIIAIILIVIMIVMIIFFRFRYYEKLIEIQDEVCYDLLSDARDRIKMMRMMGILSQEDYNSQIQKLSDNTDKLITGGRWASFLHKKGEVDDQH